MKSGFIALVGRSNVGKSTLLNALIGSKVAIVTPKAQTTRRPVRGVFQDERGQLVFVDTPGLFLGKKDVVSLRLNDFVREQLDGIDAVIYVMDPARDSGPEEVELQRLLRRLTVPVIIAVNKCDLTDKQAPFRQSVLNTDVGQRKTLSISALTHANLNILVDALFSLVPEGVAHYPEGQFTDMDQRTWIAEVIREKCFLNLDQELPYRIHVEVTEIERRKSNQRYIAATIWTTDDRYKRMVIGARAQKLKEIGQAARKELESAMNEKIFLELTVAVDERWPERFPDL